jgi:ribosome-binding protein aMBF1 (putative translation factor)
MPVVFLEPVIVAATLPEGFADIDALVEKAEADPVTRQALVEGRKAIAQNYYAGGVRSLAYYRLEKGWSQKELAARVGTSQSYIARLEAGSIDPQVSTLKRLSAVLDVTPAVLLDAIAVEGKQS